MPTSEDLIQLGGCFFLTHPHPHFLLDLAVTRSSKQGYHPGQSLRRVWYWKREGEREKETELHEARLGRPLLLAERLPEWEKSRLIAVLWSLDVAIARFFLPRTFLIWSLFVGNSRQDFGWPSNQFVQSTIGKDVHTLKSFLDTFDD